MLSINYISNYLSNHQNKIDSFYYERINDFERNDLSSTSQTFKDNAVTNSQKPENIIFKKNFLNNLPLSFELIFNKSIQDFYYDNRIFKNKSSIYTLLNSIFYIGNEAYNFFSEKDRENIMKDFIKKIDNDLFEQNLYNKFDYHKNRKFNKADIQEILKNSYQFKNSDKIWLFIQYLADYLGINIYIFNIGNGEINYNKTEKYLSKYYGDKYNKSLPNFIIILENEIYKPVLNKKNNSDSFNKYSENIELIDKIWDYLKIVNENTISNEIKKEDDDKKEDQKILKFNSEDLKKMKIDEIKNLCGHHNISLQKLSTKTSKMINKLKEDLINDLIIINK
jgi:hypothetical protein